VCIFVWAVTDGPVTARVAATTARIFTYIYTYIYIYGLIEVHGPAPKHQPDGTGQHPCHQAATSGVRVQGLGEGPKPETRDLTSTPKPAGLAGGVLASCSNATKSLLVAEVLVGLATDI